MANDWDENIWVVQVRRRSTVGGDGYSGTAATVSVTATITLQNQTDTLISEMSLLTYTKTSKKKS